MSRIPEIGGAIAPLASRTGQEKYIVHGTRDEYWLAGGIWNQALELFEAVAENYPWTAEITPAQRAAIETLREALSDVEHKGLDLDNVDNRELIQEHGGWQQGRAAAQAFLEEIGFDLATWEQEHLYD